MLNSEFLSNASKLVINFITAMLLFCGIYYVATQVSNSNTVEKMDIPAQQSLYNKAYEVAKDNGNVPVVVIDRTLDVDYVKAIDNNILDICQAQHDYFTGEGRNLKKTPKLALYVSCFGGTQDAITLHRQTLEYVKNKFNTTIYVFFANSASAGYLCYTKADFIALTSEEFSIFGSLSVFIPYFNINKALKSIGIESDIVNPEASPNKGAGGFTNADFIQDKESVKQTIEFIYTNSVVKSLKEDRGLSDDEVAIVTTGSFITKEDALSINLIDEILSLSEFEDKIVLNAPDKEILVSRITDFGTFQSILSGVYGKKYTLVSKKITETPRSRLFKYIQLLCNYL